MESIKTTFIAFLLLILYACNSSPENTSQEVSTTVKSCDYKFLEIKAFEVGTDKLLNEVNIEGCYNREEVEGAFGLIEIQDEEKGIKISYFPEEEKNMLRILDIKLGSSDATKWRRNQGHDIFINEKNGSLHLIFGDRIKSKIKGNIKFYN